MAVYKVVGTPHYVAGQGKRWFTFLNGIGLGRKANAGPFTSRKLAVDYATKH